MCIPQIGFLSDKEKIWRVVELVYENNENPYRNVDDFLRDNPKCCAVGGTENVNHIQASQGSKPPFSFWGQEIWGYGGSNVWLTLDSSKVTFVRMTNCGRIH
jgi:hypothetical protein